MGTPQLAPCAPSQSFQAEARCSQRLTKIVQLTLAAFQIELAAGYRHHILEALPEELARASSSSANRTHIAFVLDLPAGL